MRALSIARLLPGLILSANDIRSAALPCSADGTAVLRAILDDDERAMGHDAALAPA